MRRKKPRRGGDGRRNLTGLWTKTMAGGGEGERKALHYYVREKETWEKEEIRQGSGVRLGLGSGRRRIVVLWCGGGRRRVVVEEDLRC